MRDKTRKRLRKCAYPFVLLWVLAGLLIGYSGVCLQALAYTMFGDTNQAKKVFSERV